MFRDLRKESEDVLLQLLKSGHYAAFEELYRRHWSPMYGMAYNILRDREASKDIVQDIFLWFWENREKVSLKSSRGYLMTAVRFKTVNYIRGNKARAEFYAYVAKDELSTQDHDTLLEVAELEAFINLIIADLPARCSEVFSLSRFHQLSNKEIAEQLHISEKTVEGHMTSAFKKLREKLGNSHFLLYLFV